MVRLYQIPLIIAFELLTSTTDHPSGRSGLIERGVTEVEIINRAVFFLFVRKNLVSVKTERLAETALRKAKLRILPFLALLYFVSFLDRVNIGFAALTMNSDIGLSATAFGVGAGVFFLGYILFTVPANAMLLRVGASRWIALITIVWGLVSMLMAAVSSPAQFYVLRFLLGTAECGFLPGVILYLSQWFPGNLRGRIISGFFVAVPLSNVFGAPLSSWLLDKHVLGLHGWQTMFLCEAVPAVLLGIVALFILADDVDHASWLSPQERVALKAELKAVADRQSLGTASALSLTTASLGALYFFIVIGLYGFGFWGPQILKDVAGLGPASIGWTLAVPYLVATLCMQPWAKRSDQRQERVWHISLPAFLSAVGFLVAGQATSLPLILMALSCATVGIYAACPVFWTLPTLALRDSAAATGIAIINSLGNLAGYFGPTLMGLLKDRTGSYSIGMSLLAASMVVAGLIPFLLQRSKAEGSLSESS
jgi:ACS family tartrate transporter-like MFS transporter